MLQQNLGIMYLLQLWFSLDICPRVRLLYHMASLIFILLWHPALELAGLWVGLGLSVDLETFGRALIN